MFKKLFNFLKNIGIKAYRDNAKSAGLDVSDFDKMAEQTGVNLNSSSSSGSWSSYNNPILSLFNTYTNADVTGRDVALNQMQLQNLHDQYGYQISGMKDAGLNPALMYGSGVGSDVGLASSSGSSPLDFGKLVEMAMLPLQIRQMKSNIDLNKANTDNVQATTDNIKADTDNKKRQGRSMDLFYKFETELYDTNKESRQLEVDIKKGVIKINEETAKNLSTLRDKMCEEIKLIIEQTSNEVVKRGLIVAETRLRNAQAAEIYALLPYRQKLLEAQTEAEKAAAAASTMHALYEKGFITSGYIETEVREMESRITKNMSESDAAKAREALDSWKHAVQSGHVFDWIINNPDANAVERELAGFFNGVFEVANGITTSIGNIFPKL